jgi:hypothetical protein
MGPEAGSVDRLPKHARFRNPRPSERMALIIVTITATRARNPCDSVMVNNGLELIASVLM